MEPTIMEAPIKVLQVPMEASHPVGTLEEVRMVMVETAGPIIQLIVIRVGEEALAASKAPKATSLLLTNQQISIGIAPPPLRLSPLHRLPLDLLINQVLTSMDIFRIIPLLPELMEKENGAMISGNLGRKRMARNQSRHLNPSKTQVKINLNSSTKRRLLVKTRKPLRTLRLQTLNLSILNNHITTKIILKVNRLTLRNNNLITRLATNEKVNLHPTKEANLPLKHLILDLLSNLHLLLFPKPKNPHFNLNLPHLKPKHHLLEIMEDPTKKDKLQLLSQLLHNKRQTTASSKVARHSLTEQLTLTDRLFMVTAIQALQLRQIRLRVIRLLNIQNVLIMRHNTRLKVVEANLNLKIVMVITNAIIITMSNTISPIKNSPIGGLEEEAGVVIELLEEDISNQLTVLLPIRRRLMLDIGRSILRLLITLIRAIAACLATVKKEADVTNVVSQNMVVLTTTSTRIIKAIIDRAITKTITAWTATTSKVITLTINPASTWASSVNSTTISTRDSMMKEEIITKTGEEVEVNLSHLTGSGININNLIIKTTPLTPSTIIITTMLRASSRGQASLHSTVKIVRTRAIARGRMCLFSRTDSLSLMTGMDLRETMVTGRIIVNRISSIMTRNIITMDIMEDIKRNT